MWINIRKLNDDTNGLTLRPESPEIIPSGSHGADLELVSKELIHYGVIAGL